jgi:hypothetical protein
VTAQVLFSFCAAILGACVGSFVAWRLARRSAHVDRCQRHLEAACDVLQRYRVVYAQFYNEYLSPAAIANRGAWPPSVPGKTEAEYLPLERSLDEARGALRVQSGILRATLDGENATRAYDLISDMLRESSHTVQRDPRTVDDMCDRAMDGLIELIPRR